MSLFLFGSRTRDDSHEDSDVDLLCSTNDTAFEKRVLDAFEKDLVAFGGPVDLFIAQGGAASAHPYFQRQILFDGDACHQEVERDMRQITLEDAIKLVSQVKENQGLKNRKGLRNHG